MQKDKLTETFGKKPQAENKDLRKLRRQLYGTNRSQTELTKWNLCGINLMTRSLATTVKSNNMEKMMMIKISIQSGINHMIETKRLRRSNQSRK